MAEPVFDPTKEFTPVEQPKAVAFDINAPFDVVPDQPTFRPDQPFEPVSDDTGQSYGQTLVASLGKGLGESPYNLAAGAIRLPASLAALGAPARRLLTNTLGETIGGALTSVIPGLDVTGKAEQLLKTGDTRAILEDAASNVDEAKQSTVSDYYSDRINPTAGSSGIVARLPLAAAESVGSLALPFATGGAGAIGPMSTVVSRAASALIAGSSGRDEALALAQAQGKELDQEQLDRLQGAASAAALGTEAFLGPLAGFLKKLATPLSKEAGELAAGSVAKAAVKEGLKQVGEEAIQEGSESALNQVAQMSEGVRDQFDLGSILEEAAVGGLLGGTLGAAGGGSRQAQVNELRQEMTDEAKAVLNDTSTSESFRRDYSILNNPDRTPQEKAAAQTRMEMAKGAAHRVLVDLNDPAGDKQIAEDYSQRVAEIQDLAKKVEAHQSDLTNTEALIGKADELGLTEAAAMLRNQAALKRKAFEDSLAEPPTTETESSATPAEPAPKTPAVATEPQGSLESSPASPSSPSSVSAPASSNVVPEPQQVPAEVAVETPAPQQPGGQQDQVGPTGGPAGVVSPDVTGPVPAVANAQAQPRPLDEGQAEAAPAQTAADAEPRVGQTVEAGSQGEPTVADLPSTAEAIVRNLVTGITQKAPGANPETIRAELSKAYAQAVMEKNAAGAGVSGRIDPEQLVQDVGLSMIRNAETTGDPLKTETGGTFAGVQQVRSRVIDEARKATVRVEGQGVAPIEEGVDAVQDTEEGSDPGEVEAFDQLRDLLEPVIGEVIDPEVARTGATPKDVSRAARKLLPRVLAQMTGLPVAENLLALPENKGGRPSEAQRKLESDEAFVQTLNTYLAQRLATARRIREEAKARVMGADAPRGQRSGASEEVRGGSESVPGGRREAALRSQRTVDRAADVARAGAIRQSPAVQQLAATLRRAQARLTPAQFVQMEEISRALLPVETQQFLAEREFTYALNGPVRNALQAVASKGQPQMQALAKAILSKNEDWVDRPVRLAWWIPEGGLYSPRRDEVTINPLMSAGLTETSLLHEVVHMALHGKVKAFQAGDLAALSNAEIEALSDLEQLHLQALQSAPEEIQAIAAEPTEGARADAWDAYIAGLSEDDAYNAQLHYYGLVSLNEMTSEVATNPDFQKWLNQIPSQGKTKSKLKTLWQAVKETVARIVGIEPTSVAGRALDATLDLLSQPGRVVGFQASNATVTAPGLVQIGGRPNLRRAFHGTPHSVDRFSLEKIGTGEGAQVYGWGLYFAENQAVAEEYRRRLSPKKQTAGPAIDGSAQIAEEASGNTYTVDIDADPETLLDWDKPFEQQSEAVQRALGDGFAGMTGAQIYDTLAKQNSSKLSGGNLPEWMHGEEVPNPQAASERLRSLGVLGVKYLDEGSRGKGPFVSIPFATEQEAKERLPRHRDGLISMGYAEPRVQQTSDGWILYADPAPTHNFVVFDDKLIQITHENGKEVGAREVVLRSPRMQERADEGFGATESAPSFTPTVFTAADRRESQSLARARESKLMPVAVREALENRTYLKDTYKEDFSQADAWIEKAGGPEEAIAVVDNDVYNRELSPTQKQAVKLVAYKSIQEALRRLKKLPKSELSPQVLDLTDRYTSLMKRAALELAEQATVSAQGLRFAREIADQLGPVGLVAQYTGPIEQTQQAVLGGDATVKKIEGAIDEAKKTGAEAATKAIEGSLTKAGLKGSGVSEDEAQLVMDFFMAVAGEGDIANFDRVQASIDQVLEFNRKHGDSKMSPIEQVKNAVTKLVAGKVLAEFEKEPGKSGLPEQIFASIQKDVARLVNSRFNAAWAAENGEKAELTPEQKAQKAADLAQRKALAEDVLHKTAEAIRARMDGLDPDEVAKLERVLNRVQKLDAVDPKKLKDELLANLPVTEQIKTKAVDAFTEQLLRKFKQEAKPGQGALDILSAQVRAQVQEQITRIMGTAPAEQIEKTPEQIRLEQAQKLGELFQRTELAEDVFNRTLEGLKAQQDGMTPEQQQALFAFLSTNPKFDASKMKQVVSAVRKTVDLKAEAKRFIGQRRTTKENLGAFLRAATRDLKLTEKQTNLLVEAAQATFDAEVKVAAAQILDSLQKANEKVREVVDTPLATRLLELAALGGFNRETLWNLLAPKWNLPTWSQEIADELQAEAEKVGELPEGSVMKDEAAQRLLTRIAQLHLKGAWQQGGMERLGVLAKVGSGVWSAGTLSGIPTQATNTSMSAVSVLLDATMAASGNALSARKKQKASLKEVLPFFTDIFRGYGALVGQGNRFDKVWNSKAFLEARNAIASGTTTARARSQQALPVLEGFTGKNPLALYKYVGRVMAAADAANSMIAADARQIMFARYAALEKGLTGQALQETMDKVFDKTREARQWALDQVALEEEQGHFSAYTGKDLARVKARRANQLVEEKVFTPEAIEAGRKFAQEATFNSEPVGIVGMVGSFWAKLNDTVGVSRVLIPYPITLANMVTQAMRYSPLGFAYAHNWNLSKAMDKTRGKRFTPADIEIGSPEYYQALSRATFGTALFSAFAAMVFAGLDDDDPEIMLTGAGPKDFSQRKQLEQSGAFQANSLKVGSKWYRYTDWPGVSMALGVLGKFADGVRYDGMKEKDAVDQLTMASFGLVNALLGKSMLNGLADAAKIISDDPREASSAAKRLTASAVSGVTNPGLVRWINQSLPGKDGQVVVPDRYLFESWLYSMSPVSAANPNKAFNVLGEEIKNPWWDPTTKRFVSFKDIQEQHPKIAPLVKAGVYLPVATKFDVKEKGAKKERKMTDEEYYRYAKYYGEALNKALTPEAVNRIVKLAAKDKETAQEYIANQYGTRARQIAKRRFLKEEKK